MPSKSIAEICKQLAANPEALAAVQSEQSYTPILPLLEHSFAEAEQQFHTCLVAEGISLELSRGISLEKLVVFALTSWGSHWPALAISWLESGMAINSEVANMLEALSQNHGLPQSVRHQAFALAQKWRRSNPR